LQLFLSVYSEELSRRLDEDERRHAQDLVPVAAMLHGHARPYAHAQPASGDRNKKGSVSMCAVSHAVLCDNVFNFDYRMAGLVLNFSTNCDPTKEMDIKYPA
jgi:hypothetical protein